MEIVDLTAERKRRNHQVFTVLCGSCKATGLMHGWTDDAELKPVQPTRSCPYCDGRGRWRAQGKTVWGAE